MKNRVFGVFTIETTRALACKQELFDDEAISEDGFSAEQWFLDEAGWMNESGIFCDETLGDDVDVETEEKTVGNIRITVSRITPEMSEQDIFKLYRLYLMEWAFDNACGPASPLSYDEWLREQVVCTK